MTIYDHDISNAAMCFRIIEKGDGKVYDFTAGGLSLATHLDDSLKNATGATGTENDGAKNTVTNCFHLPLPSLPAGSYDLQKFYVAKASVTATTVPKVVVPFCVSANQVFVGSPEIVGCKATRA